MGGPSQFQHFITLSPSFSGEIPREESPSAPLRDSRARAGQRLPRGPLWPFTGSPQDEQHAGFLLTDAEAGVDATGTVALEEGEMVGTAAALAKVDATGAVAEAGVIGATEAEAGDVAAETAAA